MIKLEEFKKIVTEKTIVFDPFPHVTLVISRLEHFPYCHIPKRLKIIVVKMRQILMLPLDSIFAKMCIFSTQNVLSRCKCTSKDNHRTIKMRF